MIHNQYDDDQIVMKMDSNLRLVNSAFQPAINASSKRSLTKKKYNFDDFYDSQSESGKGRKGRPSEKSK